MKKYFILFYFFCCTIFSYSQWQPDFRLTTDPGGSFLSYNNAHCIAVNGPFVHVVWWDIRDGNSEIYYNRSSDNGITWQQDTRLTNSTGWSEYPSIAVSGSIVHIVWMDERDLSFHPEIYYKRSTNGGINWEEDVKLTSDPSDPGLPSLAVSGSNVYIVWYDIRDGNWEIYYKHSANNGLTWQADTRLTDEPAVSGYPSIAVSGTSPNEEVFVVWQDERDNDKEIYYKKSTDDGVTWTSDTRLTNNIGESESPCIFVENMFINIAWSDNRNGIGNGEIYYKQSTDDGQNWSEDFRITNTPVNSGRPSIAVSGNFVHISWNEVWEIYYIRSIDSGSSWETETRITNNLADSENSFVITSDSMVHLVWQDKSAGNEDIYYKRNPTGNIITGIDDYSNIVTQFTLYQNYPNPFNPSTKIKYSISGSGKSAILKVYDILGNEITSIVNSALPAGEHEIEFNGEGLASGIYFYQLKAGGFVETKKMLLIK